MTREDVKEPAVLMRTWKAATINSDLVSSAFGGRLEIDLCPFLVVATKAPAVLEVLTVVRIQWTELIHCAAGKLHRRLDVKVVPSRVG